MRYPFTLTSISNLISYEGPIRHALRDIIVVLVGGKRQGFYRSTGYNSGMPGIWLPFDGVAFDGWFIKTAYVGVPKGHPLYRFGTEQLRAVNHILAQMFIPQGQDTSDAGVNEFLKGVEEI